MQQGDFRALQDSTGMCAWPSLWLCNKPVGQELSEALPSHALGGCREDGGPGPFYGGQGITNGLGLPSVLLWF